MLCTFAPEFSSYDSKAQPPLTPPRGRIPKEGKVKSLKTKVQIMKHYRLKNNAWLPDDEPEGMKKLVGRGAWVLAAVVVICWYIAQFARGGGA